MFPKKERIKAGSDLSRPEKKGDMKEGTYCEKRGYGREANEMNAETAKDVGREKNGTGAKVLQKKISFTGGGGAAKKKAHALRQDVRMRPDPTRWGWRRG